MRIVAAIVCAVLLGCSTTPPRPRARRPQSPAFALRPLKLDVEGTSERRAFGAPVFLGIHVTADPAAHDRQTFASAMTRYMRLPVTPVPGLSACEDLQPRCMVPVGQQLRARVIVWGVAVFRGAEVGLALYALDVETAAVVARHEEMLPLSRAHPDAIQQLVERGRHAVLAGEESVLLVESEIEGTLIVRSSRGRPAEGAVEDATIVDAERRLPLVRPRTRLAVEQGTHVVAVESRGYARTERVVEVPPGYFVRIVVRK